VIPRFLHRWYAKTLHYFWEPCPLCEQYFGGHEWDGTALTYDIKGNVEFGIGICPTCSRLGAGS
jgi:hypothetical protein